MSRRRKVHVRDFGPTGKLKWTKVYTTIQRQTHSRAHGFEACAWVQSSGQSPHRRSADERTACAFGPAPRRALGAALKKLGSILVKRSSAFRAG